MFPRHPSLAAINLCLYLATTVFAAPTNEEGRLKVSPLQENLVKASNESDNATKEPMNNNVTANPVEVQVNNKNLLNTKSQDVINKSNNNQEEPKDLSLSSISTTFLNKDREVTSVKAEVTDPVSETGPQQKIANDSKTIKPKFLDDGDLLVSDEVQKPELEIVKDNSAADKSANDQPVYPITHGNMNNDKSSHFFAYLLTLMVMAIFLYLLFHNKKRILALLLEGRSDQSRRRSTRARYHKLDNNLEEAMTSTKGSHSSLSQVY